MDTFDPALFWGTAAATATGIPLILGWLYAGHFSDASILQRRLRMKDPAISLDDTPEWEENVQAFVDGEVLMTGDSLNNTALSYVVLDVVYSFQSRYRAVKATRPAEAVPEIEALLTAFTKKAKKMRKRGAPPVTGVEQEVYVVALGQLRSLVEEYADKGAALSPLSTATDRKKALSELQLSVDACWGTLNSWEQVTASHEMNRIVMAGA